MSEKPPSKEFSLLAIGGQGISAEDVSIDPGKVSLRE